MAGPWGCLTPMIGMPPGTPAKAGATRRVGRPAPAADATRAALTGPPTAAVTGVPRCAIRGQGTVMVQFHPSQRQSDSISHILRLTLTGMPAWDKRR